jgi:hypothetical protein
MTYSEAAAAVYEDLARERIGPQHQLEVFLAPGVREPPVAERDALLAHAHHAVLVALAEVVGVEGADGVALAGSVGDDAAAAIVEDDGVTLVHPGEQTRRGLWLGGRSTGGFFPPVGLLGAGLLGRRTGFAKSPVGCNGCRVLDDFAGCLGLDSGDQGRLLLGGSFGLLAAHGGISSSIGTSMWSVSTSLPHVVQCSRGRRANSSR